MDVHQYTWHQHTPRRSTIHFVGHSGGRKGQSSGLSQRPSWTHRGSLKAPPCCPKWRSLRIFFTSEWRIESEIDRWEGAAAAVMQSVYWSVKEWRRSQAKGQSSRFTGQSAFLPPSPMFTSSGSWRKGEDLDKSGWKSVLLGKELLHVYRGQLKWPRYLY